MAIVFLLNAYFKKKIIVLKTYILNFVLLIIIIIIIHLQLGNDYIFMYIYFYK